MKRQILSQLKNESTVLSGETLSSRLGFSRVSIWKHIQALKNAGYQIDATPKGYRLVQSPDTPYSWEFGEREDLIHYFDSVPSTMGIARQLARQGCPHMTIVLAEQQTQGRGRMKRQWRSEGGGLYFTMVLRPVVSPHVSARITLCAATTLAETLHTKFKLNVGVKWPNDILVAGKKVAGLLSEMEAEFDRVTYLNIGIGINVNNDPTKDEPGATAVGLSTGKPVLRNDLLASFLNAFEAKMETAPESVSIDNWKRWTVTLTRRVKVVTPRETAEGVAVDVDQNGGLVIRQKDGTLKTVVYGDCFHTD